MSKLPRLQAIRGMNDLLPAEAPLWQYLEDTTRHVFEQYGYALMRTPVLEATPLFSRAIGEVTDIVEKEMYSFVDAMNGEKLTLRPEATAGLVRAAIEHNLTYDGPKRVWTWGPMFRHERPQKGRYRQFYQFDVEAMGFAGPEVDAEQIVMLKRLWDRLGFKDVRLHLNSIGDALARSEHRKALVSYFEANRDALDADATRRLYTNPLRTLDSKNPAMEALVADAPKLADFLGDAERAHFDGLKSLLDASAIAYTVDPRLVRGFDYYNRTVFEWIAKGSDWELTIAGGGRYDGLAEQLGGKPTLSCGFGMGAERVLMLLAETRSSMPPSLDGYVVFADAHAAEAWALAERFRDASLRVALHAGAEPAVASFKSQMKKADASGARFAIILGSDESASDSVTVKQLATGIQWRLSFTDAVTKLRERSDSAVADATPSRFRQ